MNIFLEALMWFFALFGFVHLCKYIIEWLYLHLGGQDNPLIVVTVRNQQDSVEGILRSIVWNSLNNNSDRCVPNILVVDMGSTDDTRIILDKLAEEYQFIAVTDKEGYSEFLQN